MRALNDEVAIILGAGFSKCAGIPLQKDFSDLLMSTSFQTTIDVVITKAIKNFLKDVFGWKSGDSIPTLEDIFTFIDLSAGSGHHLGLKYSPKKLRALRRMLIYRTFQIIDSRFHMSNDIIKLLKKYKNKSSFIVMNWDIVLEKHLQTIDSKKPINYITAISDWNTNKIGNDNKGVKICKMHGSSNWVYCENCKMMYYQLDEKLSLHKKVGLIKSDFRLFDEGLTNQRFDNAININSNEKHCKVCKNNLATHIATFSYRKSFRTNAYPAIWSEAENVLANSKHWIFVGYSLPESDFELKHMIKSAQLRLSHIKGEKRKIDVVIYNDNDTKTKYEKFFGINNVTVYNQGLEEYIKL